MLPVYNSQICAAECKNSCLLRTEVLNPIFKSKCYPLPSAVGFPRADILKKRKKKNQLKSFITRVKNEKLHAELQKKYTDKNMQPLHGI